MSNLDLTEEARIQRNKINYFISKVGNNDFDNAIEYLILADWDEKTAVQIYMSTHQNQNIHPNPNNNNINAPKLTDINEMFQGCTSLKKIDFSTFKVQYLQNMFLILYIEFH